MELSPSQQLGLSRAANEAKVASSSGAPHAQAAGARRSGLWPLALAAAVLGIAASAAWWAWVQRVPHPVIPAPVALRPVPPVVPPPAPPAEPPAPPVQLRNPFDRKEVFEFPAGTSAADAREQMAELLLQRAQDRRSQGVGITHAVGHHSQGSASPGATSAANSAPRASTVSTNH
jgi:hypothetical protein